MPLLTIKMFSYAAIICCLLILLPGCLSPSPGYGGSGSADQAIQEMKRKFAELEDPRSSIDKAREFATEKLHDATDAELSMLKKNRPEIRHNFDNTEFVFLWKEPGGKANIEVVSTPPPCKPIAVFRVHRTYYP